MVHVPLHDRETYDGLRETAERFAREEVAGRADELDRDAMFPRDLYGRMAELGLFGTTLSADHGGSGLGALAYAIVMEELARGYSSVADQCGLVELVASLLAEHGTDRQRERYLEPILRHEMVVAYCITEAEAGSDVSAIRTTATPKGNGWALNGAKLWIHNAPVADIGLVLARTDPDKGHRGMGIFIVDLHASGVSRGAKEDKLGQRASPVGGLSFDDVTLGPDALLGQRGRGFHMMMSVLEKGRVGIAALATGIAQAALDAAVAQAGARKQFGVPIAEHQGMQWMLADMVKDVAAARALTHDAAMRLDAGEPAGRAASIAKCFASDICVARTADAIQVFGGTGYVRGAGVERLYRDAKITQIYEGTNQIQRTIIACDLLREAGVPFAHGTTPKPSVVPEQELRGAA